MHTNTTNPILSSSKGCRGNAQGFNRGGKDATGIANHSRVRWPADTGGHRRPLRLLFLR
jgi:hypothetical protein